MVSITFGEIMSGAFSQEAYDASDGPGKEVVTAFHEKAGYKSVKNEEDLGIDLVFTHPVLPTVYVEVEVRWQWDFPLSEWDIHKPRWKTLHILDRKAKYAKWYDNMCYFEVNGLLNEAFVVPGELIDDKWKKLIRNRRISSGEWMYDIPINQVMRVKL